MMRVAALILLAAGSFPSAAQQPGPALNSQQLEGLRHFNQACRVCHTKPQMTSPQYAPVLNGVSLGGNEGAMRAYIANGTQRMPGFRYHFKPAEIEAIVSYLKSVPPRVD
jgi:mono/diheme cytochrome c family protein